MSDRRSAFIIGGGSAGTVAGVELAKAGWDVRLAEPGGVGGTCLWAGCVPKKAIYVSSSEYRELGRDTRFGIDPGRASYDWPEVMAWKRHSQTAVAGDQAALIERYGIDRVRHPARFVSPHEIEAGGDRYAPDAVVIATGARTILPDIEGIDLADTSGSALSYSEVPTTLAIIGAGYIGMEFAAAYSLLGTHVTLVVRGSRVLPMFDDEVGSVAGRQLQQAGVDILTEANVSALAGERGAMTVTYSRADGAPQHVYAERVLVAVGRRPNVSGLGLDAAGIDTDARGRLVLDEAQRTTNPRVWAAGDAAGKIQLKPAAEYAGRLVAASISTGVPRPVSYGHMPYTVFTLPQIAQVGMAEADAASAGIAYHVRRLSLDELPSAIIDDERDGIIKLLFADDDGRLIGAAIAGPSASELIYACALGVRARATESDFTDTMGIHAAYSEGINYAACEVF